MGDGSRAQNYNKQVEEALRMALSIIDFCCLAGGGWVSGAHEHLGRARGTAAEEHSGKNSNRDAAIISQVRGWVLPGG